MRQVGGGIVFQIEPVFCVWFVVQRWGSRGDAVECVDGVECQGCLRSRVGVGLLGQED